MENYISREIEVNCLTRLKTELITGLIGARQVGKTTLLMKLKEIIPREGIASEKRTFYYSFDDPMLRSELKTDFRFLEKEIEKSLGEPLLKIKEPIVLIIDEAQKFPDIFDWLKIIYDQHLKKIKIVVSGSSSLGIRKKSTESLAGRITFLKLFPFTLRELIRELTGSALPGPLWNNILQKKINDSLLSRQSLLYKHKNLFEGLLERMLIEGSLPGVYTAQSLQERQLRLSSVIDTYLERDIRALGEVGSLDDYTNLLKTVSFEIGSTFNLSSISSDLGIAYNTVKKYISILKDTFILNPLPPLFRSARKRFVKNNKMYFFDVGVANFLSKRTEKEHIKGAFSGFLFENILIKSFESENENRPSPMNLYFWRDYEGHEIDMVFEGNASQYIPVEMCLGKNFPKEKMRNYHAFFKAFKESPFGILTYQGDVKEERVSGKTIYFIPWWLWW